MSGEDDAGGLVRSEFVQRSQEEQAPSSNEIRNGSGGNSSERIRSGPGLAVASLYQVLIDALRAGSDISRETFEELFSCWATFANNVRGRELLRRIVTTYILPTRGGLDVLACSLSDDAFTVMRKTAPDLYHVIRSQSDQSVPLLLLLDIENQLRQFVCRKTAPQERAVQEAQDYALCINFYQRVSAINIVWAQQLHNLRHSMEWAIPPQAKWQPGLWYVPQHVFLQRMAWLCPFAQALIDSSELRAVGAVLSGSMLPLCVLKHEVLTETAASFLAYADEVYKKCSIDIFICRPHVVNGNWFHDTFFPLLKRLSGIATWSCIERQWHEDDSSWAARNRRGATMYCTPIFVDSHSACRVPTIQVISMPYHSVQHSVAHQHLPCVRAWYSGSESNSGSGSGSGSGSIFVTASCLTSWMTRFVMQPPLFGAKIPQLRKSKTVFKYAMRGWGFSRAAVADLQLPATLVVWLQEWGTDNKKPLPWYHPLYNPNVWPKALSPDRVQQLIECSEI